MDEAEQDVFGADVGVVQEPRFFLRQHHDPACPVGKSFEHCGDRLFSLRTLSEVYPWVSDT
jgi:hypothetical protein